MGVIGISVWILVSPKPKQDVAQTPVVEESPMPVSQSQSVKSYNKAEQVYKEGVKYSATLHTSVGDITIAFDNNTPVTTNNFLFLAGQGFYENVIFHRTIPGFMIQGGDPTGTGSGGPGYKFADEEFTGEYTRGTVAMANAGQNTNGSQFFIMHQDVALPPSYVIFGHVTAGIETVDKIAAGKTIQDGQENSRPENPVKIESVTIESNE